MLKSVPNNRHNSNAFKFELNRIKLLHKITTKKNCRKGEGRGREKKNPSHNQKKKNEIVKEREQSTLTLTIVHINVNRIKSLDMERVQMH